MLNFKEYFPAHSENRMKNEGNVEAAREFYIAQKPNNLFMLLNQRYAWMNEHLEEGTKIIELGAGAGFSEFFLKNKVIHSDVVKHKWIDLQIDALDPKLKS